MKEIFFSIIISAIGIGIILGFISLFSWIAEHPTKQEIFSKQSIENCTNLNGIYTQRFGNTNLCLDPKNLNKVLKEYKINN